MFLSTLLQELNLEFALQLDISPKVDRLPPTTEVSSSRTLIFGGGSHAGRLALAVGAIYPEVVDLTAGGWKLSEKSAEDLAFDLENVLDDLDPADVTFLLHMFDNSIYRGNVDGHQVEPVKLDGGYHIPGNLEVVDSKLVKELFETAMPVFKAARGAEILIVGPLQRYVVQKCCGNPGHITNFADPDYGTEIASAMKEVGIHLWNLIHTRWIKAVKILNLAVLMGIASGNAAGNNDRTSSWGRNPVHPLDTAYATMAKKILEEVNEEVVVNSRRSQAQQAAADGSTKTRRECWTEAAPTVASRTGKWSHGSKYGGGRGNSSATLQHKRWGNRGGHRHGRSGYGHRPY